MPITGLQGLKSNFFTAFRNMERKQAIYNNQYKKFPYNMLKNADFVELMTI